MVSSFDLFSYVPLQAYLDLVLETASIRAAGSARF